MEPYSLTTFRVSDDSTPRFSGDNYGRKGIYDNLDHRAHQVRLIQILPGGVNEKVCCRMQIFDLNSHPDYTALSYTWGSPPALHRIYIGNRRFLVRKNLWRFLRQVRSLTRFEKAWFWIDALCINQDHLGERAHQVSLMPQIYKTANTVLVWLGPAYAESDQVPKALALSSRYGKGDSKILRVWSASPGRAISSLCSRPYWKRLWIFQELMLARQIQLMCGKQVYDWEPFQELVMTTPSTARDRIDSRLSENLAYRIATDSAATSIMRQIAQETSQRLLLDLICSTSRLRSLDVRDKIYGLLGVASAGHFGIDADYSVSLQDLLNCVLRKHHQVQPPRNCAEVWQQCQDLAGSLVINEEVIFTTNESIEQTMRALELLETTLKPAKKLGKDAGLLTLEWAISYNHRFVAKLIFHDMYGIEQLHKWFTFYAQTGNIDLVSFFLRRNPDIGEIGRDVLEEALILAAGRGHGRTVKLLIDSMKADADEVSSQTIETSFIAAIERGYRTVVKPLLETGQVDINAPYWYGHRALHIATEMGHVRMIKQLLKDKAIVPDSDNRDGETALHVAAKNGRDKIARLLITVGKVDVNAKDGAGQTPLYVASRAGFERVAEVLLDIGNANPSIPSLAGLDPLQIAAFMSNDAVVRVLLNSGEIDVEARDFYGRTALHGAVHNSENVTPGSYSSLERPVLMP